MSQYYNPRRKSNLYDPKSTRPFRLSRSKIDLFLNCQRCFYLDRRLGVAQPPGFPFNLNSAVDALLKKEFDLHRVKKTAHPMLAAYGIKAIPFAHAKMDEWRDALRGGVAFHHVPSGFLVTGGVDDIWVNDKDELHVVDYKATAKDGEVSLDADWQIGYKRQVEVYQWLLRQNGFKVSPTAYFVYCNGKTDAKAFDAKLEFDVKVIPYKGNDGWVDEVLVEAKDCLSSSHIPDSAEDCDYCAYRAAAREVERKPGQQKLL
ncbi:MAG: PD-(D/E)XK nuclease family protein [Candidatus Nomurabacteria bacterium]|nr:MAG: PD-(D/E)XK nuclease family protein [Candidatus Nomurabacteria bacterium]